ncbi:MAG TPA: hypothetical protein VJ850_09670 [Candidatus Limnocylindrales bacterium]|nr:hypothetical protein [Candidatus Limnocylindrales bacterium]
MDPHEELERSRARVRELEQRIAGAADRRGSADSLVDAIDKHYASQSQAPRHDVPLVDTEDPEMERLAKLRDIDPTFWHQRLDDATRMQVAFYLDGRRAALSAKENE